MKSNETLEQESHYDVIANTKWCKMGKLLHIRKRDHKKEPREVPSENPYEFFRTPYWCTHRLSEAVTMPAGRYLEPAAGDGAIVKAILHLYDGIEFDTVDLVQYPGFTADLYGNYCNFPELDSYAEARGKWDCIITNPPYSMATEFVKTSLRLSNFVVMLLRLAWLSAEKRADFIRANTPDVYVLPNRPSFDGYGSDPKTDYGWFIWDYRATQGIAYPHREKGDLVLLNSTPLEERR